MTVTYTDDTVRNEPMADEVFVPRYARTGRARSKGGIRTWMILAPIGALAVIGGGALMVMGGNSGGEATAQAETAAPLVQPAVPLESSTAPAASASTALPSNATISDVTPAPVVREAPPAPPPAIQRRQPAQRSVAPAEPAPVVEQAPAVPTGPQPYVATPPATEPATRTPSIVPVPLS